MDGTQPPLAALLPLEGGALLGGPLVADVPLETRVRLDALPDADAEDPMDALLLVPADDVEAALEAELEATGPTEELEPAANRRAPHAPQWPAVQVLSSAAHCASTWHGYWASGG